VYSISPPIFGLGNVIWYVLQTQLNGVGDVVGVGDGTTGVIVLVGVMVLVGVIVGVIVLVGVIVGVMVLVGVIVGVMVLVGVIVGVMVLVGVGAIGSPQQSSKLTL
jgi:hypothetical protein